jgi:uncharacterized RDD family membrane protein YckC
MEYKLASLSKRFAALVIDGIIISIIAKLAFFPFGFSFNWWEGGFNFWHFASFSGMTAIIGFLYYAVMESSTRNATFGKQAMHLKVYDEDGNGLNLSKSIVRNLVKVICGNTFIIGYLVAAFTKDKQALHDLVASTVVVEDVPVKVR